MQVVIEGLALERPRLPIVSIPRRISSFARWMGEEPPSYWVVRDLVRQLPEGLLTLAHQGPKAYSEMFDLVHRREAPRANAIWQADHAQLEIELVRDDGSVAKPWLTVVIDDYSRAVAGYYLAFEPPSVLRTALTLRQGIWRKQDPHWPVCGIPSVLYTDHGSDFTSRHMQQVAADLKMQLIFATPGQPRGRGRIERFFRTVHEMFLCDIDGYLRRSRRKPPLQLRSLKNDFGRFCSRCTTVSLNRRPTKHRSNAGRWVNFYHACRNHSSNWTCCLCMLCGRAKYSGTVSASRACDTCLPFWRPMSEKRSPSVLTRGIWERSECSSAIASSAVPSRPTALDRACSCARSSKPATSKGVI